MDSISGHPEIMQPPLYINNISVSPLFTDPFTDFSLLTGSPCINIGTFDLPEGIELPDLDLAGNSRVYEDFVDLGPYEWQGTGIENDELTIESYTLRNYPNPFNPTTMIEFSIQNDSKVELSIYNIKGQKVKQLIIDQLSAGEHSVVWDGRDENNFPVGSGIYFYKLRVDDLEKTRKMILMK